MSVWEQAYKQAAAAQAMAAEPQADRLASANAGSGKTRVLVNRVARLLLARAEPETILCLTYTKAAASEMQARLFEKLGAWSILPEAALYAELSEIMGDSATTIVPGEARKLFAKALETPDGLKVQTIHAFCERILSRFPVEAGLLPGFEALDESEMPEIIERLRSHLFTAAAQDDPLREAVEALSLALPIQGFDSLLKWMVMQSPKIEKWQQAGGIKTLATKLGVAEDVTREQIKRDAWQAAPHAELAIAAVDLCKSPKAKEVERGRNLQAALTCSDPVEAFDIYAKIVLKDDLSAYAQVCSASGGPVAEALFGKWNKVDTPEMHRMVAAGEQLKAQSCLSLTRAIHTVSGRVVSTYKQLKHAARKLDFNDQIHRVHDLLVQSEMRDWIRYKLDGGISHILIDEAQDTSPVQWQIIDAIQSAFLEVERDPHKSKTFFAVGDEKQSIYSFQGARPEVFLEKIRTYIEDDAAKAVNMRMSFRSCAEVLRVVDGVFVDKQGLSRMFDVQSYAPASDDITHSAFRQDAGRVDLWPLCPAPEMGEEEVPWDLPVDRAAASSSREQLAAKISEQVGAWLVEGEPVFDRALKSTRPMQPSDILILVQKRGSFFDALIRNLKSAGVAVAGADRLVLTDSLIIQDFLSLGRFVLLPSDDLSLAEVLRSPIVDLSEEDLFQLAHGRRGTMWQAMKMSKAPNITAACEALDKLQAIARKFAPYEFFAWVLSSTRADGVSVRKGINARFGLEAGDILEAFLAQALAYQRRRAPSLQHFIQALAADTQDIKRDLDSGQNEVRVMTVHGAKGLEAPVVILPDTTQIPKFRSSEPVPLNDGFVWLSSTSLTPQVLQPLIEQQKARVQQEYMRLLYVAMTRAESRLVICGFETGQRAKDGLPVAKPESWYGEMAAAMDVLASDAMMTPLGEGRCYGHMADAASSMSDTGAPDISVPDWLYTPARRERLDRHVSPSHILAHDTTDMPVHSPLQNVSTRFWRGNLIHKLLEILPDLEPGQRRAAAQAFLASYKDVTEPQAEALIKEVFGILNHPDFVSIFAQGSRAETSLAGRAKSLPQGLYLNGQIDRLQITETHVYIIDYKSNRPPPKRQEDVADIYMGQMAAYRELAREIYPDKTITCALLWTDGPSLMVLDDARLDMALTQIGTLPI